MVLLITGILLTSSVVYMKSMNTKLIGKTIIIDVGHGGKDSGTVYKNIKEKDINLDIALKLKEELILNGVNVLMVRDGDFDLSEPNANRRKKSDFDNRIKLINDSGADLYLSIHMNYLDDSRYYGAQVFYTDGNEVLASNIQSNLDSPLKEKKLISSIYMYKKLKVPGVLIECGFLSNDRERSLLQDSDYQDKLVDAIIEGLLDYY